MAANPFELDQRGVAGASSNIAWSPGAQPVTNADLQACPVLVLHYWASWNRYDPAMDERLNAVRERYAGRICFRSCDVDRAENQPFVHGIWNIPALGCFIRGRWYESVIGMRSEEQLRSILDGWLDAASLSPAGRMSDVKRSRKMLNGLTVLSLMLFAALAAVWVDHRICTEPGTIIRPCMEIEVRLLDVFPPAAKLVAVDLSGHIELPILGKMQASGLTCAQLEAEIDQAFRDLGETKLIVPSVRIIGFQPPSGLVMSLLLAIPALRVLGFGWASWKSRRRFAAGLCPHCGYDIRATPERCPECGKTPRVEALE